MGSVPDHSSAETELQCEPDEVPVRFLAIIAGGVTAVTLVMIFIAVWLFDARTASELQAKGYTVDREVPVDAAGAGAE